MRNSKEIYEDAVNDVLASGNQSLKSIALCAIEKAQREMFQFLYDEVMLDDNKKLSIIEFFDKMDRDLKF